MADIEIQQVPRHIVHAFTARYGKIGERLDQWEWLDLFYAWHAGWQAGTANLEERFAQAGREAAIDKETE